METGQIRIYPDEVLEILKKHFKVKDARVHAVVDGREWKGLRFGIYDKEVDQLKKRFL